MPGPEKEFRAGGVSATIWNNQQSINGKEIESKSIQIQRNYLDANKNWQKSGSFKINDLFKVICVAQASFNYLTMKERGTGNIKEMDE